MWSASQELESPALDTIESVEWAQMLHAKCNKYIDIKHIYNTKLMHKRQSWPISLYTFLKSVEGAATDSMVTWQDSTFHIPYTAENIGESVVAVILLSHMQGSYHSAGIFVAEPTETFSFACVVFLLHRLNHVQI